MRARAIVNLFGALGRNQYLEKPVIAYDITHSISLLSLLYRSMNSVFNSFGAGSEAGNRSRFRVEGLKYRVELRDCQQILQTIVEVEQLDVSVQPLQSRIAGDKFTEPAAVHIFDPRQVDDQLTNSGVNSAGDMLSELRIFIQGEISLEIKNRDIIDRAFDDVHPHSFPIGGG